jgi:GR25 family glycosyltransferase involved in LPS biosynthesis
MGGFNNFDLVYYINLNHRTDRLNHIISELKKTNIDESKVHRIEAIYVPDFGALGCSKSHCVALENFINSPETNQTCVVLEDDFEFTQGPDIVNDMIDKVFNSIVKDFDVLMLSSNTYSELNSNFNFVTKILKGQTTSGYVVSRKFAPILLKNYKEGVDLLSQTRDRPKYSIDMYMQQLQPNSKWLCLSPKIGKQMDSYSDIEKYHTIYNC